MEHEVAPSAMLRGLQHGTRSEASVGHTWRHTMDDLRGQHYHPTTGAALTRAWGVGPDG